MTAAQMIQRSFDQTLVIGHRGAAAYQPENTIESFEEAIRCGVAGVECDVHVSRDGELMVIHDGTLDRTTSLTGNVSDTDACVMRAAGVPTLDEYLKVTKGRAVSIVELKAGANVVDKSVTLLREESMLDETVFFSFDECLVREARSHAFSVRLSGKPPSLEECDGIGVAYEAVDGSLVKTAHAKGLPVFAWTVPPGGEVVRLRDLGVNFIITNHPREVLEQLGH